MTNETSDKPYESIFYRSHDDLLLHARVYGEGHGRGRSVVCLPGLTRNAADFHALAAALAADTVAPRTVYCLDFRGRGRSEWDQNWESYSPYTEAMDTLNFFTLRQIADAAVIGTSRGGIVAMLMAVMRPAAVGCLVLNDIGPVIETSGLARILSYAGKIPVPRDWGEARRIAADINHRQFTAVNEEGWDRLARQLFLERDGRPAAAYDPNIGKALGEIDISEKVPDMWEHFEATKDKPLLVLRGEHSDILSPATVALMQQRHPSMVSITIQNEGHAPLLWDGFTHHRIAEFLNNAEPL